MFIDLLLLNEHGALALLNILNGLEDFDLHTLISTLHSDASHWTAPTRQVGTAYIHRLVVQSTSKLLGGLNLPSIVLLTDTQRRRQQIVLGILCKRGAHTVGVPLALRIDELLGQVFLLFACHLCGSGRFGVWMAFEESDGGLRKTLRIVAGRLMYLRVRSR